MAEVLVCGSAVVDFVFQVERFPDRPEKYAALDAAIVGGGCAGNAAVAIARLGGKARLAARCGEDLVGEMTLADLAREGVDVSGVLRTKGGRSAYSAIHVDAAGERQITAFRGVGLAESWEGEIGRPGAILADTRWPAAAARVLAAAREIGIPGVLDGEAPVAPELARLASHVVFSAQGLRAFSGEDGLDAGLARARGMTDAWLAVTDGGAGTLIEGGGRVAAPAVDVVDTLGAGDVWHGAFALRLAEGAGERDAVAFANAAASVKCTRPGGRLGAPVREEVAAHL